MRLGREGLAIGFVVAVVGASACRAIVGIDDRTVAAAVDAGDEGPTCPIPGGGTSACRACVAGSCCAQAKACTDVPGCRDHEACLFACAGDPRCRAQCALDHPVGASTEVAQLDACLATSCEASCNLTCGGLEYLIAPGVASTCEGCIAGKACENARACATNADCQLVQRCERGCRTIDCRGACATGHRAGADLANKVETNLVSDCQSTCAVGNNWTCVGNVSWPLAKAKTINLTVGTVDFVNTAPVGGIGAKLCPKFDVNCSAAIAQAVTNDAGLATLTQSNIQGFGLDGYVELSSPNIITQLVFWSHPLSEPEASLPAFPTIPNGVWAAAVASVGLTPDPTRGHLGVGAVDCALIGSPGVQFSATGIDSATTLVYFAGGVGNRAATATDSSGLALFFNVPPGSVEVTATPAALGRPAGKVTAVVRAGVLSTVRSLPAP